jgi:ppGpp synthetase/RelA/SpoT-type nucleotidyltranferase
MPLKELDEKIIEEALARYWREYDRYEKLADIVRKLCNDLVEKDAIRASVTHRAKSPDRLRDKLNKYLSISKKRGELYSVDAVMEKVGDLAGVRITTYVESDRGKVVEVLTNEFNGLGEQNQVLPELKDQNGKLYRSTHCQVLLKDEYLSGKNENLRGLSCEIQICSLLAHVYNEIEHDLRYKPFTGALSPNEDKMLDALGALTSVGDVIIGQVLEVAAQRQEKNEGKFEDKFDFVVRMKSKFPSATNFPNDSGQLYEECMALSLDNPKKITEHLLTGNYEERSNALISELMEYMGTYPSGRFVLDPISSDQLLVLLLDKHVEKVIDRHPAGRGLGAGPRIRSIAARFYELKKQQIN